MDGLAIDVAGYCFAYLGDVGVNFCEIGVAVLQLAAAHAGAHACAYAYFFLIAYLRYFEGKALGFAFAIGY